MDPRIKQLLMKILLACSSVVVLLVVMEIALSTFSYFFYPRLTTTDADLGWIYVPTAKAIERHDRGGVNKTFINKDGFRDKDFATDDDYLRIMVLGDSMTFGLEADQDEIFPLLVEQKLQEILGTTKIDVMNFGITGFSTTQELLCLKKYQPKFKPDIVVLAMDELNDFEDNTKIFWNRFTPHFEVEDGQYVLHDQPTGYYKVLNVARDHSTLFYFVAHLCTFTRPLFIDYVDLTESQRVDLACYILKQIQDFTQEKGIRLYMLYLRNPAMPTDRYDAVREFAEAQGIPIRIIPIIKEERVGGIGHWSGKGHASAAEILTEVLLNDSIVASKTETAGEN
jgi:hypothetical protein